MCAPACVILAKKQQKKKPTPARSGPSSATIDISSSDEGPQTRSGVTIQKVQLNAAELDAIQKGDRLQGVHIAMAHTMLKQQFPERAGFQSTYRVTDGTCAPQDEGTIQIHFDKERKHWLTTIFSGKRIHVFDSLYTGFIPDGVQQQMRAIYGHLSEQLSAQVVRVQQQQGVTDCGLFAIAYAVHLANGNDPAKVKFEQKRMRAHLTNCLKKKRLEAFPIEKTIARVARPDIIRLQV